VSAKKPDPKTGLIVNFAPTGMVPTRAMNPAVPLQPDEIIASVRQAAQMGITMTHLHARDQDDKPTYRRDIYSRIINGIREDYPELVIGVSCSGRDFHEFEKRSDVLMLEGDGKPDFASLTLSSMNFARQASVNAPDTIRRLLETMLEKSIRPEFEIFDLGMANYASYLIDRYTLKGPFYANIMLGNIAGAQADLLHIAAICSALPADTVWGLGGMGDCQPSISALAVAVAPAVRIGLEDNLWDDPLRMHLTSNGNMVRRIHQLAELSHRTVMSPQEFREMFDLGGR
jgi:3-keto-5-aminohexanoate cleavage enzyme